MLLYTRRHLIVDFRKVDGSFIKIRGRENCAKVPANDEEARETDLMDFNEKPIILPKDKFEIFGRKSLKNLAGFFL